MTGRRRREVVQAWLLVAAWTFLVWRFSTDAFSAATTSRFLEPLLHWIFPDLGREAFRSLHFFVRKGAHLLIYGVLGGLAWRALRVTGGLGPVREVLAAGLLVLITASTDEIHQGRSHLRRGSARDVGIDAVGGALGIASALLWRRRRSRGADGAELYGKRLADPPEPS